MPRIDATIATARRRDVGFVIGGRHHDTIAAFDRAREQAREIHCKRSCVEADADASDGHIDERGKLDLRLCDEIAGRARTCEDPAFLCVIVREIALHAFERHVGELCARSVIGEDAAVRARGHDGGETVAVHARAAAASSAR